MKPSFADFEGNNQCIICSQVFQSIFFSLLNVEKSDQVGVQLPVINVLLELHQ